MDLEPGTVMVLVTRCDHSYAATDDVMIVFLQPFYLTLDYGAHSFRRLGSFERHLNGICITTSRSQRISNFAAAAKRRINRTVGRGRNPCSSCFA